MSDLTEHDRLALRLVGKKLMKCTKEEVLILAEHERAKAEEALRKAELLQQAYQRLLDKEAKKRPDQRPEIKASEPKPVRVSVRLLDEPPPKPVRVFARFSDEEADQ
jgi:hypothetical protein